MDTAVPTDLPSLSVAQLAACMGRAAAPLVIDVRRAAAFDAGAAVIAGALCVEARGSDWVVNLSRDRTAGNVSPGRCGGQNRTVTSESSS